MANIVTNAIQANKKKCFAIYIKNEDLDKIKNIDSSYKEMSKIVDNGLIKVVENQFTLAKMFFPFILYIKNKMWYHLIVYIIAMLGFVFCFNEDTVSLMFVIRVYVIVSMFFGFNMDYSIETFLSNKGYTLMDIVCSSDKDEALLEYLNNIEFL